MHYVGLCNVIGWIHPTFPLVKMGGFDFDHMKIFCWESYDQHGQKPGEMGESGKEERVSFSEQQVATSNQFILEATLCNGI